MAKLVRQYDLTADRFYVFLAWKWLTRAERPNAPAWWTGGYSRHWRLFPVGGKK